MLYVSCFVNVIGVWVGYVRVGWFVIFVCLGLLVLR